MLRKGQEGHVRAERDILKSASLVHSPGGAEWIVRLYYSFQDRDNLYLVSSYGSLFPSLPWVFLILISFPGHLLFSLSHNYRYWSIWEEATFSIFSSKEMYSRKTSLDFILQR